MSTVSESNMFTRDDGPYDLEQINPDNYFIQQKYRIHAHQIAAVVRNKSNKKDQVSIRLRMGKSGYSEWLNELQVYLLPNFKHDNILPFLGADKRLQEKNEKTFNYINMSDKSLKIDIDDDDARTNACANAHANVNEDRPQESKLPPSSEEPSLGSGRLSESGSSSAKKSDNITESLFQTYSELEERMARRELIKKIESHGAIPMEFFIFNQYNDCVTLRHYLINHVVSWPNMLKIAVGIMRGLEYLHELAANQQGNLNETQAIDGYLASTKGALKRISVVGTRARLHMKPPFNISILHRNLTSLNIVLRHDFSPCIWNFGTAQIHHPFQPVNRKHKINRTIKSMLTKSPYTPPEVLDGATTFTLSSLKAIDLYACGLLYWELLSRCIMPPIDDATDEENYDRLNPDRYQIPFKAEASNMSSPDLLREAVCRLRTRPAIKEGWLVGRKTTRFVNLITNLWDFDVEARPQAGLVLKRLERISTSFSDKLVKLYFRDYEKKRKVIDDSESEMSTTLGLAQMVESVEPNLVFERVYCSSDSDQSDN